MKCIVLLFGLLFGTTGLLLAQINCISGIVVDEEKESLPFATVQFFREGVFLCGLATDLDGRFTACGLPDSGLVDVQVDYIGFTMLRIEGVSIKVDSLICEVKTDELAFREIEFLDCSFPPLIEADNMTNGQTFNADQIRRQPNASYNYEVIKRRQARRKARREKRLRRKAERSPGNSF